MQHPAQKTKRRISALTAIFLCSGVLAPAAGAVAGDFCSSTAGLNDISRYLYCENKTTFNSCAGLGTKLAGRYFTPSGRQDLEQLDRQREEAKNAEFHKIVSQIFESQKTYYKTALQQSPKSNFMKVLFADGHEGPLSEAAEFSALPVALQTALERDYRNAITTIARRRARGGRVEEGDLIKAIEKGREGAASSTAVKTLVAADEAKVILQLMGSGAEGEDPTTIIRALGAGVGVVIVKSSPVVIGGAVTVAAFLVNQILGATSLDCHDPGMDQINMDKNCHQVLEVNARVLESLGESEDVKAELLKTQSGCSFFYNFSRKFLQQPKMAGLTCGNSGLSLNTVTDSGDTVSYKVRYFSDNKSVRQIEWTHSKPGGGWSGPVELTANGEIKNMASPYVAQAVLPMRLFLADAASCCATADDGERAKCRQSFSGARSDGIQTSDGDTKSSY